MLFRPWQYYKNVLIFFGIVFSGSMLDFTLYMPLVLGFISLCLISSVNYIINDLRDREHDKLHPEKKNRPIASGNVSILEAYTLLLIFGFLSIIIASLIPMETENRYYLIGILVLIFTTSQLYTYYFKHKALFDVTFIALNYIWRAIAGVIIIDVYLSPWLFALGFLFALFLALAKRRGDLILLGDEAKKHRKVFEEYNLPLLDQFITIVIGSMIVSWAIYIIEAPFRTNVPVTFTNENLALLSIPLVTISALKLVMLLQTDGKYARRAELLFFNSDIIILGVITGIVIILAIYWDNVEQFVSQII
ncbi:MAG: Decaprenyl-phosphate phosphoribosyltransferase [Candidatus Heimdallarchaeota archaeon LC_3]|nr:MAG: Decaprenyl-phosphate phosphoribosyltransferase [Candidatus Heimdallarchaeota archaeon LC_3]